MAVRNKDRIAAVFEEMIGSTYLDDIAVSDIMERCHMPRTAFYRYFKDKYDLITFVYLNAIEKRLEITSDKNWRNSILICYQYIYEKRNFFRRIIKYKGQNNFLHFLYDYSYKCIAGSLCAANQMESLDYRLECSVRMYCSACSYLVDWWLTNGLKISPAELYEIALENIPVYLKDYLEHLNLVPYSQEEP